MKSKERAVFSVLLVVNLAVGYYIGRPTQNRLHEEFIRGAVTVISYQYVRDSTPSGLWLDAAFDYVYVIDHADFNTVDKAVINRVATFDTIRHDTTLTWSSFKNLFIKPNVKVKFK